MGELKNFVTTLHESTKRDHLARMNDNKVACMEKARKFEFDYWDGDRRYGYGGYKYIEDRWKKVALDIIDTYDLKDGSKLLDIGCGKGFILYEIHKINPKIQITGIDISKHALNNFPENFKCNVMNLDARKKLPFDENEFDLVISIGTFHNFRIIELENSLREMQRVAKKSYLMVESYRNSLELFNLQCWALTCDAFFDYDSWLWLFEKFGFEGDYEFIYFK